ncbi:hypothetical protein CEUSTIGMA_g4673.t1 [Chlamydomonas eustigma]|uniref:Uncharacterized protein n=1 Tax=Chlamydomonas eustigma TaxID=1157962 RepID=A0A250X2C1_9CHLO|nr:hypothetical protein CEUSTIGMA_g4673.t1 [Chlamydomonas eustigma]|eukprot:GAX77227.1 hypothetical protein CEUSTIGMA_g4673.t1 [Chlamydomonas eustigma]
MVPYSIYLVMALASFSGGVVRGVSGFGSAIMHVLVWIVFSTAGVDSGSLQLSVTVDCVNSFVVAIPLLIMTSAFKTGETALVVSVYIFQTLFAPVGAIMLLGLDVHLVEMVMACTLLVVITLTLDLQSCCQRIIQKCRKAYGYYQAVEVQDEDIFDPTEPCFVHNEFSFQQDRRSVNPSQCCNSSVGFAEDTCRAASDLDPGDPDEETPFISPCQHQAILLSFSKQDIYEQCCQKSELTFRQSGSDSTAFNTLSTLEASDSLSPDSLRCKERVASISANCIPALVSTACKGSTDSFQVLKQEGGYEQTLPLDPFFSTAAAVSLEATSSAALECCNLPRLTKEEKGAMTKLQSTAVHLQAGICDPSVTSLENLGSSASYCHVETQMNGQVSEASLHEVMSSTELLPSLLTADTVMTGQNITSASCAPHCSSFASDGARGVPEVMTVQEDAYCKVDSLAAAADNTEKKDPPSPSSTANNTASNNSLGLSLQAQARTAATASAIISSMPQQVSADALRTACSEGCHNNLLHPQPLHDSASSLWNNMKKKVRGGMKMSMKMLKLLTRKEGRMEFFARAENKVALRLLGLGSLAGTVGGIMAGLTGMGGPPLMLLYRTMGTPKEIVRGTNAWLNVLQFRVFVYLLMGMIPSSFGAVYLISGLSQLVGLVLGNCMSKRISPKAFSHILVALMLVCMVLLFLAAFSVGRP